MASRLSYRRYDSWDGLALPLSIDSELSDKGSESGFDFGGRGYGVALLFRQTFKLGPTPIGAVALHPDLFLGEPRQRLFEAFDDLRTPAPCPSCVCWVRARLPCS
jgi:hypothetical protein